MSIPISDFVKVNIQLEPEGVIQDTPGIGLLIIFDNTYLPNSAPPRYYSNISQVAQDFPPIDRLAPNNAPAPTYTRAKQWFAQSPTPKNLIITTQKFFPTYSYLYGIINISGGLGIDITNESFDLRYNGTTYTIGPMTISSTDSGDQIAAIVNNAISGTAIGSGVDAFIDAFGRFIIKTSDAGSSQSVQLPTTQPSSLAQTLFGGSIDSEAGSDGLGFDLGMTSIAQAAKGAFTFVMLAVSESAASNNGIPLNGIYLSIADWIEREKRYILALDDLGITSVPPPSNPSEGVLASFLRAVNNNYQYSFLAANTGSSATDYTTASSTAIAAKLSAVDFTAANSTINIAYKTLNDVVPLDLTQQEYNDAIAAGANVYANFANTAVVQTGIMQSKEITYIDTIQGLIWFKRELQKRLTNLLSTTKKIPQTDAGNSLISGVIREICEQAKRNGFIATGTVSDALINDIIQTTGNVDFKGVLHNGYLLWSQPVASQSQEDRDARKATKKKIWLKAAGATNEIAIDVILEE